MVGGGVLIPSTTTERVLDLVMGGHVLLVLSDTSTAYVSELVVLLAGKLNVKLKV
jgi:hypothetical protein